MSGQLPASISCPILTENSVQHHLINLLAIIFLMVPDFAWFDEKKVEFDQYKNFCSKVFFQKNWCKILPNVKLFCIIWRSKLNTIEKLTTLAERKFNTDLKTGIGLKNWASFVKVMKENVMPVRIDNTRNVGFWIFVNFYVKLWAVVSLVF